MKKNLLYFLTVLLVLAIACKKEKSFEGGNNPSEGSLQSDVTGDCLPKSVDGIYEAGTALVPGTNTITVTVNVTKTGAYVILTDTVNGFSFKATGTFATTGVNTVKLNGSGNPLSAGTNNFVVSYGSSVCSIAVAVLPTGGANPAVYTLVGAGASCTNAVVNGSYVNGIALTASNTVTLSVSVTTIGTYTITTTFQGMTFAKTGVFITTGPQTVTLNGSGTPTTGGDNTIPITAGATTCSFVVNVTSPAQGTLSGDPGACTSTTIHGDYVAGTALVVGNTVEVQITTTSAGAYSISTDLVDGMTFSATGSAVLGTQLITLAGTGTPTNTGDQTFTVTFGTSACTFKITVNNAIQGAYTLAGSPGACTPASISGIYMQNTVLTADNTLNVSVDVTSLGAYTITTNTVDGFSFSGTGTFTTTGVQIITLTGTGTPTNIGDQAFTVTGQGTNTCTYTVTVLPIDYYPRTTDSNWSYELDDNSVDSFLRKVIAPTLTVGANSFNIFMADFGDGAGFDSAGYHRKAGGDYFEWIDLGAIIGFDPPAIWGEYIFLKDNVPVSTTWFSNPVTGSANLPPVVTLTVRFKYSIEQKDVPITIASSLGSKTYQNVIVVKEEYQQFDGVNWNDITTTVGYGKSYYARGIGLIQYEIYDPTGTVADKLELRRYEIH